MTNTYISENIHTIAYMSLCLVLMLNTGCEQMVDIDGRSHESRLVVTSRFTAGAPWQVDVSRSVGAFDATDAFQNPSSLTVSDASVTMYTRGEMLGQLKFVDSLEQYVTNDFLPEPNTPYTIRVKAPEFDVVQATDQSPTLPPVQLDGEIVDNRKRALHLTIDDSIITNDYYEIKLRKTIYYAEDTISFTSEFETTSTPIVTSMNRGIQDINKYKGKVATFDDRIFNGSRHTFDIYAFTTVSDNREVMEEKYTVTVSVLSQSLYEFVRSKRLIEQSEENPFVEPVNIDGNVRGGYGIFGGFDTDTTQVVF